MSKLFLITTVLLAGHVLQAQQKQGTVVYERTLQMQMRVSTDDVVAQALPQTRKDKFELQFANNQSIWQHVDESDNDESFSGNGMHIQMIGPGQNDVVFYDFNRGRKVEQKDIFDKNFIVSDSIHALNWKMQSDTQTIMSHVCQKAVAQHIGVQTRMTMSDGKMEKKEVADTSMIVAWFTSDIPVPAGPEVQGQLPGLILALEMNDGKMVYKAIDISLKANVGSIKEPTKGKKVSPDQFTAERDKMIEEMQKNNQGGHGNTKMIIRAD